MDQFDRREFLRSEQEKQRQRTLLQVQEQLQQKKEESKELARLLQLAESEQEKKLYTYRLNRTERLIVSISSRLKDLGVTEKRGRPKKAEGEHYQEQRKKFTARLQIETVEYLKQLKEENQISNISAFLDELVAEYQKKNR